MTISALGGRDDLMRRLNFGSEVEMGGTHFGRIYSVVGALATIACLERPGFYEALSRMVLGRWTLERHS